MDDSGPTASIIFFVLLVLIDIFFYGFEAAINELNLKDIEKREEEKKDKKSKRLKKIISDPEKYINMVQLIVILINMIMGAAYLRSWLNFIGNSVTALTKNNLQIKNIPTEAIIVLSTVLTIAVVLYIILTFGVLLPKKIAVRIPEKWAYTCINPIYFITILLSPFIKLVMATTNLLMWIGGVKASAEENDVTEEEIINMVNEGHEQGLIQASEAEMISNIFEFGDKEAQNIMTNRKNVVAIDAGVSLKEAIDFMLLHRNSRYPVYEENLDHIIGILHLKDAMRFHTDENKQACPIRELEGLLRDAYFVPRTKNIDELFKEMQSKKLQMVIVIDEYGQTDGLVAMEDILEEIVGNILDEYDEDTKYIEQKGKNEYIIDGKMPLEELEEILGIHFEEKEFETLNGFLIARLDRIPEENEQFEIDVDGYHFCILSVENKMIRRVLVTKLKEKELKDSLQSPLEEKKE